MSIERKYEKEYKKSLKLKQLISKHFRITPLKIHIKYDDNNFFFWKNLIQEYSNKKSACEFIDNQLLLPQKLRELLKNCIVKELRLEIDKLKKIMIKKKILIEEDKKIPEHDKQHFLDKILSSSKKQLKILTQYLSNESSLCNIIKVKNIDQYLQRRIIECIERTLVMNIQSLPLKYRIKIVKELETVIPKIEIEKEEINYWFKLEKGKIEPFENIKPLHFQIFDVLVPIIRDKKLITALENITNYLNEFYKSNYKKLLLQPLINEIKLISTLKFLKPFVNEIEYVIILEDYIINKHMDKYTNDLNYIKSILSDYIYIGRYEFPIITNNLEEYIVYLINNLNLYETVLKIELPESKTIPKYKKLYKDFARDIFNDLIERFGSYGTTQRIKSQDMIRIKSTLFNQYNKYMTYEQFENIVNIVLYNIKSKYHFYFGKELKTSNEFDLLYEHLLLYIRDKFPELKIDESFKTKFIEIINNLKENIPSPPDIKELQEYKDIKSILEDLDRLHLRELVYRMVDENNYNVKYNQMKMLNKEKMIEFILNNYFTINKQDKLSEILNNIILEIEQTQNIKVKYKRYKEFLNTLTFEELLQEIKLNNQQEEWKKWKKELNISKPKENHIKVFLLD